MCITVWVDFVAEKEFMIRVLKCAESECPEVTLCGWQDIKIQLPATK